VTSSIDPLFDIAPAIAKMAPHTKRRRAFLPVAPCVKRLHGDVEVVGEVLGAEQFIESFHRHIVARVGVDEITDSYQALLAKGLRRIRHRRCRLSVIDPIAICNPSVTHL